MPGSNRAMTRTRGLGAVRFGAFAASTGRASRRISAVSDIQSEGPLAMNRSPAAASLVMAAMCIAATSLTST